MEFARANEILRVAAAVPAPVGSPLAEVALSISCVLEDKPVPVSGEEAMLATQAIEAVVQSYKSNKVVKLT